jgi:hypothetical protein
MIDHTKSNRDEAIRARLLNSLGIRKDPSSVKKILPVAPASPSETCRETMSCMAVEGEMRATVPPSATPSTSPPPSNTADVILLNKVPAPAHRESLNDSKEHEQKRGHRRVPSRKRIVQFDGDVIVQPIASHKAYSKRIKRTLWTSAEELSDHVHRNTAEFMAEGMDWKTVLEDDDMYMDAKTGELIHPYWVESHDSFFEAVDGGAGTTKF